MKPQNYEDSFYATEVERVLSTTTTTATTRTTTTLRSAVRAQKEAINIVHL